MATHKVVLESIRVQTHDVKTYALRMKDPSDKFEFLPGQFLMLSAPCVKDGSKVNLKRAYSIASSPTKKDAIELTIKKTGTVTTQLDTYTGGEEIEITGPYGMFTFKEGDSSSIMGIAAGVGIAPIWSIFNYIKDKKLAVRMTLLFSNKTPGDLLYKEEIAKLTNSADLKAELTVTRPDEAKPDEMKKWAGKTGRISKEMIIDLIKERKPDLFYVCGKPEMVTDCVKHLTEISIDKKRIHAEKF
ncbi:MAG: FAD-binding oxidoreductase [Nanoarchaeota archaeon]